MWWWKMCSLLLFSNESTCHRATVVLLGSSRQTAPSLLEAVTFRACQREAFLCFCQVHWTIWQRCVKWFDKHHAFRTIRVILYRFLYRMLTRHVRKSTETKLLFFFLIVFFSFLYWALKSERGAVRHWMVFFVMNCMGECVSVCV